MILIRFLRLCASRYGRCISNTSRIGVPKSWKVPKMDSRCFQNPYPDYGGEGVNVDKQYILSLIKYYVNAILKNTKVNDDERGDLYVGNAGRLRT